jgi:hypothetical protein
MDLMNQLGRKEFVCSGPLIFFLIGGLETDLFYYNFRSNFVATHSRIAARATNKAQLIDGFAGRKGCARERCEA